MIESMKKMQFRLAERKTFELYITIHFLKCSTVFQETSRAKEAAKNDVELRRLLLEELSLQRIHQSFILFPE